MDIFVHEIPMNRMIGSYNYTLVALSYIMACAASYVALDIASNLYNTKHHRISKLVWLCGGSFAMGSGIWSMHFVGMLAYHSSMPIHYDFLITAISMAIAIFLSFFSIYFISKKSKSYTKICIAGILLGICIASMHYTGMAAMKMQCEIKYIPSIFIFSIIIAIGAAIAGLFLIDYASKQTSHKAIVAKIISAFIIGLAICGMHYTGMEATVFIPLDTSHLNQSLLIIEEQTDWMLSLSISVCTLLILFLAILASIVNQRLIKYLEIEIQRRTRELRKTNLELSEQKKNIDIAHMRAELVVEYVLDAIIIINHFGEIQSFNRAAECMFGYRRHEVIGKNVNILMTKEYQLKHNGYIKNYLNTKKKKVIGKGNREFPARKQNGTEFIVQLGVMELELENEYIYIGVLHDITEQKIREEELQQAKDEAEKAATLKSDFLANMSHEIRTPMNAVIGMTGLLLDTELSSQQKNYIDIIRSSGEALLDLINDILDFSKIEAGELRLEKISFDLFESIQEVFDLIKYKAKDSGLALIFEPTIPMPFIYIGDPGRIRQVLLNLLSNAVKFTKEGYIMLSIHHEMVGSKKAKLYFSVKDTGIGISEEKKQYIFNKFSQAEESTTRKYGGTGLGLAICKKIVEILGGSINADSTVGKGSSFYFDITLDIEDRLDSAANYFNSHLTSGSLQNLKILLLDSNELNHKIIAKYCSHWDFICDCTTNKQEALRLISTSLVENDPYSLIFIDYLTVCKNLETLETNLDNIIKYTQNKIPLILTLQMSNPEIENKAKSIGFKGLLHKPFYPSSVFDIISNTLAKRNDPQLFLSDLSMRDKRSASKNDSKSYNQTDLGGLKFLVVEDMPVNQMLMVRILTKHGAIADTAANGIEAIEMNQIGNYDLIFMDCQMPEMDGYDATKNIREYEIKTGEHVPIVALTADAMEGDKQKCLDVGMDEYLNKPVRPHQILAVIQKYCQLEPKEVDQNKGSS